MSEHTTIHTLIDNIGLDPNPTSGDTIPAARNCNAPIAPDPAPAPISRTASTPNAVAFPNRSPVAAVITNKHTNVGHNHGPTTATTTSNADVTTKRTRPHTNTERTAYRDTNLPLSAAIPAIASELHANVNEYTCGGRPS